MGILDGLWGQDQTAAPNYPANYFAAMQPQRLPIPAAPAPIFAPARPDQTNFNAAVSGMNLNPQEQALYQRHLDNLYGAGGVDNMNGSRSTLYQMSTDMGGQTYNLPTVYDGQILSPDAAIARAHQIGLSQFPSYPNGEQAEARYQQMHSYMERDAQKYLQAKRR